jgi:hypothetical protein
MTQSIHEIFSREQGPERYFNLSMYMYNDSGSDLFVCTFWEHPVDETSRCIHFIMIFILFFTVYFLI